MGELPNLFRKEEKLLSEVCTCIQFQFFYILPGIFSMFCKIDFIAKHVF